MFTLSIIPHFAIRDGVNELRVPYPTEEALRAGFVKSVTMLIGARFPTTKVVLEQMMALLFGDNIEGVVGITFETKSPEPLGTAIPYMTFKIHRPTSSVTPPDAPQAEMREELTHIVLP